MSLLGELRPKKGSTHNTKRLGRGTGSGKGGTSTKGHKGQKARKSGNIKRGFEGGQTPLARRLPKFGFTNGKFKTVYELINLKDLDQLSDKISSTEISPEVLVKLGYLKAGSLLKILGFGQVTKNLTVKAHKFSQSAKDGIEKSGGKIEVL